MTSASMRRLPMRMMEHHAPQDENAMPAGMCALQAAASVSPSRVTKSAHTRSPSKMPTLSDIAARLNLDRDAATPTTSPAKQLLASPADAARPRLELTGRITGSPRPLELADRKSPLIASPTKLDSDAAVCLSPTAPSSGACSPTKRMLAKGLPSLEEIRDRMSRKGLSVSAEGGSPNLPCTPPSPTKQAVDTKPSTAEPEKQPTSKVAPSKPALQLATHTAPLHKPSAMVASSSVSATKYPLQHEWTLFFDSRAGGPPTPGVGPEAVPPTTPVLSTSSWEASLRTIGTYAAVETMLGCFSKLHRPSQLERHTSYHLFKDGIKPMWEDARNANGGKWTITFRQRNPALVDRTWLWLVLGLIGEELDGDDEACGAVCSVKPRGDRIALWMRDRSDTEKVNRMGRKLVALLEIGKEPGMLVEFSAHSSRDDKQEGLFSVNNAVQQLRTPTVTTFNAAAAGLPEAPHRFASASPTAFASPASPNRHAFRPPPSPGADTLGSGQFARLAGQAGSSGSAAMFGRSPNGPNGGGGFGALGQSLGLGLGIGVNTSPSLSPSPNEAKRSDAGAAMSWRSNRTTSPTRQSTTSPSKAT
ncbi:related to CDC33 - translation initiation factor eIF4E [Moesziomyces antarcticus]|nr:related to CDC33 - translation initiation factor eIF4E [Moesziomyces antarcticus]